MGTKLRKQLLQRRRLVLFLPILKPHTILFQEGCVCIINSQKAGQQSRYHVIIKPYTIYIHHTFLVTAIQFVSRHAHRT